MPADMESVLHEQRERDTSGSQSHRMSMNEITQTFLRVPKIKEELHQAMRQLLY